MKNHIKTILCLCLCLALFALAGCKDKDTNALPTASGAPQTEQSPAPEATTTPIDNNDTKIVLFLQDYQGDSMAEILGLEYANGQNPEIDSLNNAVMQGIQSIYEQFMLNKADDEWITVISYPFTSKDYLQIVTTVGIYQDGDLTYRTYSYNFSKADNVFLNVQQVMQDRGLEPAAIQQQLKDRDPSLLYEELNLNCTVTNADLAGFYIARSGALQLIFDATLTLEDGFMMSHTLSYMPNEDQLSLYRPTVDSFDEPDAFDPPLVYQSSPTICYDAMTLSFDMDDLEEMDGSFTLDYMVFYAVEEWAALQEDSEKNILAVLDLKLSGQAYHDVQIARSDAYTGSLAYGAWEVRYITGDNEDTMLHQEVYVPTDVGLYVFTAIVPIDFADDYQQDINMRMASLYWEG